MFVKGAMVSKAGRKNCVYEIPLQATTEVAINVVGNESFVVKQGSISVTENLTLAGITVE